MIVSVDIAKHQMSVFFYCHQLSKELFTCITVTIEPRAAVKLFQVTRTHTFNVCPFCIERR